METTLLHDNYPRPGEEFTEDDFGITRREFGLLVASSLATFYGAPDLARAAGRNFAHRQPVLPNRHHKPMRRGISVGEFYPDVNGTDYTKNFTERHAETIIVWAPPWRLYEPEPGQFDQTQMARFLNDYAAARSLPGKEVYVAIPCDNPPWISRKPTPQERLKQVAGHSFRPAPIECGPNSPVAHYFESIFNLCLDADGIIGLNEPNIAFGSEPEKLAAKATAEIMITQDILLNDIGYEGKDLGPAPADIFPDFGYSFSLEVLKRLHESGHKFKGHQVPVLHFYELVSRCNTRRTLDLVNLYRHHWIGKDRTPESTEGGYRYKTIKVKNPGGNSVYAYSDLVKQERQQVIKVLGHFIFCQIIGMKLWTNYMVIDPLNNDFRSGLTLPSQKPHPIQHHWEHDLGPNGRLTQSAS